MPAPAEVDAYVLAGGRSVRMGQDKATAPFAGGTLLDAAIASLRPWSARIRVVRRPDQAPLAVDTLTEPPRADVHPLHGVAAALADARAWALVLPVDVVGVRSFAALLAEGPAVAWDGVAVHPLVALLPASWAGRAAELAARGASARELVADVRAVWFDPAELRDRNRPADLGGC